MEYIIFHKDYPVLSVSLDDGFSIDKINKILSHDRLPPGLFKKQLNLSDLNYWFFSRGIPADRKELSVILDVNNRKNQQELIVRNLGLGLVDYYWIKDEKDSRKWGEVNFFQNAFSQQGENIYIGDFRDTELLPNQFNPNNLSSGMLPKKWIRVGKTLYMIKGSELQNYQEPFNEVVVSKYLDNLSIDHVHYDLHWHRERPYSKCPNMLDPDEELVHAYYVKEIAEKDNRASYLSHYVNCCQIMGLDKNIKTDLDNMILVDYLTANTDRHWSNFGVIRDVETLQAKRLAPIYDNGAAFFAKFASIDIPRMRDKVKCQSFRATQQENIKLVTDFSLLKNKAVSSLPDLLEAGLNEKFISKERKNTIIFRTKQRIRHVKNMDVQ